MSRICANNSNPTPGVDDGESGSFNQYFWQDFAWMTNLFNGSANGGPVGVSSCFDLPIENGPEFLPDNSGCYSGNGIIENQPCQLSFTGQSGGTAGGVRGYIAAVLGSRAGCHESWGVACGLTPILMEGTRDNGCPIYDMNTVANAVGYPVFSGSLPQTRIQIATRDCGDPGIYNTFQDTYWHDVTDTSLIPEDVNGNPIAALQDTINGINVRHTAVWNTNFWFVHPDLNNLTTYTGGTEITTTPITIGGHRIRIVVKHETGGTNNFFYLGFVFADGAPNADYVYNDFADWMRSQAFLDVVYNHPASQAIIANMASPTNGARPKTVRPPDANFVVDSIQLGNEMWGTVNANEETVICWDGLAVTVDGTTYGKVADVIEPPPPNDNFCELAFILSPGGCPLEFSLTGCDLPFSVTDTIPYEREVAECGVCPCYTGPPVVIPPGASRVVSLEQIADFTQVEDAVIRLSTVSDALSITTVDAAGAVTLTADTLVSQNEEGVVSFRVTYSCPETGTQVCDIEVPVFVCPETLPGLEGCVYCLDQGESLQVPILPVDGVIPSLEPVCQPSFGTLRMQGPDWIFETSPGEFGKTEFVVPVYRGGQQGKQTQRKIHVCVKPPTAIWQPTEGCRSVLEVKPCWADDYIPVSNVTGLNITATPEEDSTYISLVTKTRQTVDSGVISYSVSINGDARYGSAQDALQVDHLVDVRIRAFEETTGNVQTTLQGTMRVKPVSISKSNSANDTFSVSLESHGAMIAGAARLH